MASINGISFPFVAGPNGIPAPATDSDAVKADLFLLFSTPKGTRVMNSGYGVTLPQLVFENSGKILQALIRQTISSAIKRYESRVKLQGIGITTTATNAGSLLVVTVAYIINGFQDKLVMNINPQSGAISMAGQ